jgi:predicted P-loop ATPase
MTQDFDTDYSPDIEGEDLNRVAHDLLWPRTSRDDLMYVSQALSGGDYLSCGLFQRAAIGPKGRGRTMANCARVTTLLWDADLVTLYESLLVARRRPVPAQRAALKAQLYRLPVDHVTILRNILVEQLVPVWSDVMGMQPTVVLDSGWGVHVHLAVEHEVGENVADIATLYADLTRRINERVSTVARQLRPSLRVPCLFDRLTVGAQLARPPGTVNRKCEWEPRQVQVLELNPEVALCGTEWSRLQVGLGTSSTMFDDVGLEPRDPTDAPTLVPVPARKGSPVEVDFSEQHIGGRTWADVAYALAPGERVKVKCPFGGNTMGSGFFAREPDGRTRYYSAILEQTFWDTVVRRAPTGQHVVRLVMRPSRKAGEAPKPVNSLQNLQLMMANDPDIDLWWDEFTEQAMDGEEELDEDWWLRTRLLMESKYGWSWSAPREVLMSTASSVAKLTPKHKPRRWLEQLAVEWDRKPRLKEWMHRTLGVDKNDTLLTEYSLRWPIALVSRMLDPGNKQDAMLVLQGDQGIGKSTVFEVWGSQDDVQAGMFVDTRIRIDDKDALLVLSKCWILEDAELLAHQGAGAEARKSFLSSRVDTFRRPYARRVTQSKRHCVVVGSTNSGVFLKDVTGSRRYWVVECGESIDIEWLRTYRNQLLGEAVMRYRDGERWWLSNHQEQKQQELNRRYLFTNSYVKAAEALHDLLPEGAAFTTELVAATLGVSVKDHYLIRRALVSAGWKTVRTSKWRGWSDINHAYTLSWDQRKTMGRVGMSKLSAAWDEMFRGK